MKLNRAPPLAAVLFGAFLLGLAPHMAHAGNVPIGGGGSCPGQTITDPVASTQGQQQAFDDGLYTCTGTAWVPEAFIIGGVDQSNAAPSCNSTNAGMVKYSGGTFSGCDGSAWRTISTSANGAWILISTQTASSSASLQFTSLPTSYNTLFMNCNGLLASNGTANLYFRVGEGAGPTWKSTAHYTESGYYVGAQFTTPQGNDTTTATDLSVSGGSSATIPTSIKLYIDNVSSTTLYKNITFSEDTYIDNDSGFYNVTGSAYWNNDTNAITGLQVTVSTGTIASGSCSLYGIAN